MTGRRSGEQPSAIASALRDEITSGLLKAGEPLRQEQLAERFESSRMPIREALRILEHEGFVVAAPNKGAVVAPIDPGDLREIYEMRTAAETLALRLAIPELPNSQIERAAAIQKTAERSSIEAFGTLNREFHATLYQPCARPRLLAHIAGLNDIADRYLRVTASRLDYADRSHREHRILLDACRERDEKRALRILADHITAAGETLYEFLLVNFDEGR